MAGDYSFTDCDLTDNKDFDYAPRGKRQLPPTRGAPGHAGRNSAEAQLPKLRQSKAKLHGEPEMGATGNSTEHRRAKSRATHTKMGKRSGNSKKLLCNQKH